MVQITGLEQVELDETQQWRTDQNLTWRMWGTRSKYKINQIFPNGQVRYSKIFPDHRIIEMSNPIHYANFKLEDDKTVWRDREFRTASESATQWVPGEYAIMTILGDIWVKVTHVSGEKVFGEVGSEEYVFVPTMGLNGAWQWKEKGRSFYPLRHDDGHFHEYDD